MAGILGGGRYQVSSGTWGNACGRYSAHAAMPRPGGAKEARREKGDESRVGVWNACSPSRESWQRRTLSAHHLATPDEWSPTCVYSCTAGLVESPVSASPQHLSRVRCGGQTTLQNGKWALSTWTCVDSWMTLCSSPGSR